MYQSLFEAVFVGWKLEGLVMMLHCVKFHLSIVVLKSTITSIIVVQLAIRHPIHHPEADDDSLI